MRYIVMTLLLVLPLFPARAGAAAPGAGASLAQLPGSFTDLYQKIVAQRATATNLSLFETVALSEAAARLYLVSTRPSYREMALRLFRQAINSPQFTLSDFHVLQGFGRLAALLQEKGLVPADLEARLGEIARAELKRFVGSHDDGDYNIRIGEVEGSAGLLQCLNGADYPDRGLVQAKLDHYWRLIRQTGDLDEDAANYDSLGCVFCIDLARLLGREDDLRDSPGFRRMFNRFRDMVSPSGMMPEYGDSYFSYLGVPLDRVFLLEYAARLYSDPTFLWAARKLYIRPTNGLPRLDDYYRAIPLIDMPPTSLAPAPPVGPASTVTYRARRGTAGLLADKLILRTGRQAGDAMVMMDLYASGSHSHPDKGPSIAYYEVDQVPLFHNMGRHQTRSALDGNLLWAAPGNAGFPGGWKPDIWHTMTAPFERLPQQNGRCTLPDQMVLRNFAERDRQTGSIFFDNLRLTGPAGVRLLDGFESPAGWDAHVRKETTIQNSPDHTQGAYSQQVDWKPVPSGEVHRKLPDPLLTPFTRQQYTALKIDVKYTGVRPYVLFRSFAGDLGDQLLAAQVHDAAAEQRGMDASGVIHYQTYITPDSTLNRRIVLTAEGYLVVCDTLKPGPSMAGYNAGQLWQMYAMNSRGPDWFCSQDDGPYPAGSATMTRCMLVKYDARAMAHVGVDEVDHGYYCPDPRGRKPDRFYRTYSQRPVTPGLPEVFTQVVLPLDPPVDNPAGLAGQVHFESRPGGAVTVIIPAIGKASGIRVTLGPDEWNVDRKAILGQHLRR